MSENTSSNRFDGKSSNYVRFRPSYPTGVLDAIIATCSLGSGSPVADLGAGTGIFSGLLLERGLNVFAVEPNAEMREAAEQSFGDNPRFQSVSGSAEKTGLPANTVDAVTAAQSMHWFDIGPARKEILRILKPAGWFAATWNQRDTDTPFQRAYADMLRRHISNYDDLVHTRIHDGMIEKFFGNDRFHHFEFSNGQLLDFDGLRGRMNSSSYVPAAGTEVYEQLSIDLNDLFAEHEEDGRVSFDYKATLYVGQLT